MAGPKQSGRCHMLSSYFLTHPHAPSRLTEALECRAGESLIQYCVHLFDKQFHVISVRFDIKTFDKNFDSEATFDSEGFSQSKSLVDDIVAREVASGIPHNRIILGGFSQGGAVTLYTGLQAEYALGGLLVLSSWMPARWRFPAQLSSAAKGVPIWQGHGTMDPLIPLPLAQMSHEFLKGLGLSASLSTCVRGIVPLLLRCSCC
jgi:predicted esterase